MEHVPFEIVQKILMNPTLNTHDVLNFASTCSYFYKSIRNSSAIWKSKFFQKWPQVADLFGREHSICYFEEFQYVYDLRRRTRSLLSTMPSRFYNKEELSDYDLDEWETLANERERAYHYLVLDLREILRSNAEINSIEVVPFDTPGNKTIQYYAGKVLRHIKQLYLEKSWTSYISLPLKQQILEKGAVFVAQWCQPEIEISYDSVARELDRYAQLVRTKLHVINPRHSLFNIPQEDLKLWKVEKLEHNQFKREEFQQIFEILNEVIYTELGFSTKFPNYRIIPHIVLITTVIVTKKVHPVTLRIIYESVARRLGLIFEPTYFLEDNDKCYLLRFNKGDDSSVFWNYFYLFDGSLVQLANDFNEDIVSVATTQQVIEGVVNLQASITTEMQPSNENKTKLRSIRELCKLVNPQDLGNIESLAKFYMLRNMNSSRSLENCLMTQTFTSPEEAQRILHMLRDFSKHVEQNKDESFKPNKAIQRDHTVNFAVGMVMSYRGNGNKCVITGWDLTCSAPSTFLVFNTDDKLMDYEQPFYHVLFEDGFQGYIAQGDLVPSPEVGSLHSNRDLDRYFSHFFENHFVPNAEKEKEYSADKQTRHRFHHEMQTGIFQFPNPDE